MSDPTYRCSKCDRERENCSCVTKQSAPVINKYTLIFYQDGEELSRMRSLAKRRKERVQVLEELLEYYRQDVRVLFQRCESYRKRLIDA
ncbi:hypothetical protein LCGC14_2041730 [marine sediment metagenome]|uniref:Uncharacterized protein n=1 Tax=marine sediment metagenome TaxID=412755 RepID=A0A0F9FEC1_9ZZZZ